MLKDPQKRRIHGVHRGRWLLANIPTHTCPWISLKGFVFRLFHLIYCTVSRIFALVRSLRLYAFIVGNLEREGFRGYT